MVLMCGGGACRGGYVDLPAQSFPSDYLRVLLPVLSFRRGNGNLDSRPIRHPQMGSTIRESVTSPSDDRTQAQAKTGYGHSPRLATHLHDVFMRRVVSAA